MDGHIGLINDFIVVMNLRQSERTWPDGQMKRKILFPQQPEKKEVLSMVVGILKIILILVGLVASVPLIYIAVFFFPINLLFFPGYYLWWLKTEFPWF